MSVEAEARCPICGAEEVFSFMRELEGERASGCKACGYSTVPHENAWGVPEEFRPFLKWAPPGNKPMWWPDVPWWPEGGVYSAAEGVECEIRPRVINQHLVWVRCDLGFMPRSIAVYASVEAAMQTGREEHAVMTAFHEVSAPKFQLLNQGARESHRRRSVG